MVSSSVVRFLLVIVATSYRVSSLEMNQIKSIALSLEVLYGPIYIINSLIGSAPVLINLRATILTVSFLCARVKNKIYFLSTHHANLIKLQYYLFTF